MLLQMLAPRSGEKPRFVIAASPTAGLPARVSRLPNSVASLRGWARPPAHKRGIRSTSGRRRRDADPVGLRDTIGSTDLAERSQNNEPFQWPALAKG